MVPLDLMRLAGIVNREAIIYGFEVAQNNIGITTKELAGRIGDFIRSHRMNAAFKGYLGFPGECCICVDEEMVHGVPGTRKITSGSILTIDCGVDNCGYFVDAAYTDIIGRPRSDDDIKLVFRGYDFFKRYIKQIRAGMTIREVAQLCDDIFRPEGFDISPTFGGHGIGPQIHKDPFIFHTLVNINPIGNQLDYKLHEDEIVCIEPVISLKPLHSNRLDDGWTIIDKNGTFSAHFEHTVKVSSDSDPEIIC